ncbi:MAG: fasciclin domain-containing protein [Sandaracinaceae bacterium]|nr:fasciclin domain-containing protein [Sandaracinaceae bacterium]
MSQTLRKFLLAQLCLASCVLYLIGCGDDNNKTTPSNDSGPLLDSGPTGNDSGPVQGGDGGQNDGGQREDANPGLDSGPGRPTIWGIVSTNPDFSLLKRAIERAAPVSTGGSSTPITDVLNSPGPFTVFAPNNAAFMASGLTEAQINGLQPERLRAIITYHALGMQLRSSAVSPGVINTLSELPIFVTVEGGVRLNGGNAIAGGANVTTTDVEASNGIIHVIDRVLLPPTVGTLPSYAGLTRLSQLLRDGALVDTLSGPGPFTFFAPNNEAIQMLSTIPSGDGILHMLRHHVVNRLVTAEMIPMGVSTLPSLERAPYMVGAMTPNLSIVVRKDATGVRAHGGQVVRADLRAENGVVHIIDRVILQQNLWGAIQAGGLDGLRSAVMAAAPLSGGQTVQGALESGSTRITLFAPTNDAFNMAFPGGLPSDGNRVRDVLLYHAVPQLILSSTLPSTATDLNTLLERPLRFEPGSPPRVGGANIIGVDFVATNGIIHLINQVLIPPSP